MPTPPRSRRTSKAAAKPRKPAAAKPKKPTATAVKKKPTAAPKEKPAATAVKKKPATKAGLRQSEAERCASAARMLQRALRRHPKLKGVRVVARATRLSFFEVPEGSVDAFATILERMWSRIRRYVE